MEGMNGTRFEMTEDEWLEPSRDSTAMFRQDGTETELEFLTRRALEESRLAKQARTPKASAAHSYLAAAYSAAISKELARQAELEDLLLQIH